MSSTASYRQRGLHAGYHYQDLLAAQAAAEVLLGAADRIEVETPRFAGDCFDDVIIHRPNGRSQRIQSKRVEAQGPVTEAFFTGGGARLPVLEALASVPAAGDRVEVRLMTTATPPDDDVRAGFLIPSAAPSLIPGSASSCWHLDAEGIWPDGDSPRWPALGAADRDSFSALCAALVLELGCEAMSTDLSRPGPAERLLLARLDRDVGVGRYPNERDPSDIAARLLAAVGPAKGRHARSFSFVDLTRELGLRVDRGSVPQRHPLDEGRYVSPVGLETALKEALRTGAGRVVVIGPPGAGKTWALEEFARGLRARGAFVARHYCYLTPGDPDAQARVGLDTMAANLVAELLEDDRLDEVNRGVGGGLEDLRRTIRGTHRIASATQLRPPIVLVVDGLDHVARVPPKVDRPAASPVDFASVLAGLDLPAGVTLVVASQPGAHLDPLFKAGARRLDTPPFSLAQTARQLGRLGLLRRLRLAGFSRDRSAAVRAIHERSDGNPLLNRFLGAEVVRAIEEGAAASPSEAIAALPGPPGEIAAYYEHLLGGASAVDQIIAEHLALMDFAVTANELATILPAIGERRVRESVARLAPVLSAVASTGGVRIYHESLRRFIVERLSADGRHIAEILNPVIVWLEGIDFLRDPRSYRHLLPLLSLADRGDDLLSRIGVDFVSRSVVALQPPEAVAANIRLASRVAADRLDFPALASLSEQRRAASSAADEIGASDRYPAAVIEIEGPEHLAERLLWEGRAVYSRARGVRLCAMVDEAGAPAPWSAYLDLPRADSHPAEGDFEQEQIDLVRGSLRRGRDRALAWLAGHLNDGTFQTSRRIVRGSAQAVVDVLGLEALESLVGACASASAPTLSAIQLEIGLAREVSGDVAGARTAALDSLSLDPNAEEARELLRCGVSPRDLATALPGAETKLPDVLRRDFHGWSTTRQFAGLVHIASASGADLGTLQVRLWGSGWYRRWLRFVIDLATARDGDGVIVALGEAAAETDPFAGDPRACDLYGLEDVVAASFAQALDRLDDAHIDEAVRLLLRISEGTTTYLMRLPNGPFTVWRLLDTLLSHARRVSLDELERASQDWGSQFYGNHAETQLALARLANARGERDRALRFWAEAGRYMAGYGWHKDITAFGFIEGLMGIEGAPPGERTARLRRLQPLTERARLHSDGRETHGLPGAWLGALTELSPGSAARSLARTILRDAPIPSSEDDRALERVLRSAPAEIPPLLLILLWRCLPAAGELAPRLECVDRLLGSDRVRAGEAFFELAAAADGDREHPDADADAEIRQFALAHGLGDPGVGSVPETRPLPSGRRGPSVPVSNTPLPDGPDPLALPPEVASTGALVAWAREASFDRRASPRASAAIADAILRRLNGLHEDTDGVVAVAIELGRRRYLWQRADLLERLAESLLPGDPGSTAEVYVLAWCASGGDWEPFGGLDHRDLLHKAAQASVPRALARLATEITHVISTDDYAPGILRRTCEALNAIGDSAAALASWDRAFEVLEARLPQTGPERRAWEPPDGDLDPGESVVAYAEILGALIHHPDLERAAAAIGGLAEFVEADPVLASAAVLPLFRRDATVTDQLAVVGVLDALGTNVDASLEEPLTSLAGTRSFGVRETARALLTRAGRGAPRGPAAHATVARRTDLTRAHVSEVEKLDQTARLKVLSRIWPDFTQRVAERYWALWGSGQEAESICGAQAEEQFSRSSPWVPALPMRHWRWELLECALHDTVPELQEYLIRSGRWRVGDERALCALVCPDIAATAARGRSRCMRPGLPLPRDTVAGMSPLTSLGDAPGIETGPFAGWTILAAWERELIEDDYKSGQQIAVYRGLGVDMASASPTDMPFEWMGGMRWHTQSDGLLPQPTLGALAAGWLAEGWTQHDALAWDRGLTVCSALRARFGLDPAPPPRAFDLNDRDGPAVAYRQWRMRPYSYEFSPPTPLLAGGALLIRPDLAERLDRLGGGRFTDHLVVERTALTQSGN